MRFYITFGQWTRSLLCCSVFEWVVDHDVDVARSSHSHDARGAADGQRGSRCVNSAMSESSTGSLSLSDISSVEQKSERMPRRITASSRSLLAAVQKPFQAWRHINQLGNSRQLIGRPSVCNVEFVTPRARSACTVCAHDTLLWIIWRRSRRVEQLFDSVTPVILMYEARTMHQDNDGGWLTCCRRLCSAKTISTHFAWFNVRLFAWALSVRWVCVTVCWRWFEVWSGIQVLTEPLAVSESLQISGSDDIGRRSRGSWKMLADIPSTVVGVMYLWPRWLVECAAWSQIQLTIQLYT